MYLLDIVVAILVFSAGFVCGAAWNGIFRINNERERCEEMNENKFTGNSG